MLVQSAVSQEIRVVLFFRRAMAQFSLSFTDRLCIFIGKFSEGHASPLCFHRTRAQAIFLIQEHFSFRDIFLYSLCSLSATLLVFLSHLYFLSATFSFTGNFGVNGSTQYGLCSRGERAYDCVVPSFK